nr:hypothetical protein [Legionella jordanis]
MNISLKEEDFRARKQYWLTQIHFLILLIRNHSDEFRKILSDVSEEALTQGNFSTTVKALMKALENPEHVRQFVEILEKDELNIKLATIPEKPHSDVKKDGLHLVNGDVIQLIKSQIELGQHVVVNDAANSHRDGAAKYNKGSVEELIARHTDAGWKMLLHFENVHKRNLATDKSTIPSEAQNFPDIDVIRFQGRYLKMMLNIISNVVEHSENYLKSQAFLSDLFLSQPDPDDPQSLPIYFEMQNNCYEVPIEGFTSERWFSDSSPLQSLVDVFREQVQSYPITVVSYAAADRRTFDTSPMDQHCTSNKILQNPSEESQKLMIEEGVKGQCFQAVELSEFFRANKIQKSISIICLMPGCGAFANPAQETARYFFETLKNNYSVLEQHEITCFVPEFSETLFNLMARECDASMRSSHIQRHVHQKNKPSHGICFEFLHSSIELRLESINLGKPAYHGSGVVTILPSNLAGSTKKSVGFFQECKDVITTNIPERKHSKEPLKTLTGGYLKALDEVPPDTIEIHLILMGTGGLKYSISESITALMDALGSKYQHEFKMPKIILHINENSPGQFQECQTILSEAIHQVKMSSRTF